MTAELALIDSLPVAAFATDAEGRVVRHNAAAAALWGRSPAPGAARWSGAWRLLAADGEPLDPAASPVARTLAEGRAAEPVLLVAERPDGGRAAFVARPALLTDADGRVAGVLELMLEAPGEPADLAAARLAAIVSSSDDAIVGKSLEGRVTSWNDAAERIFGWSAAEMVGQSITRIIPDELLPEEASILARLRRGERVEHFDTERVTKDRRRIAVSLTVSPIRDAQRPGGRRLEDRPRHHRPPPRRGDAAPADRGAEPPGEEHAGDDPGDRRPVAEAQPGPGGLRAELRRPGAGARPRPRPLDRRRDGRGRARRHPRRRARAGNNAGDDAARVAAEGPAALLEPRLAVQMALVLHELVSNARQHGALARPGGRVTVDWRIEAGPEGRRLGLDWREQGAAPAPPETGTGFGVALIERSLAANGGTAVRRAAEDGIAWEIGLPLPELPAALPLPPPLPSAPAPAPAAALDGARLLVVEDEPLVALEIEAELTEEGAVVVGPAGSLEAAMRLIEAEPIDAALLDANLAGKPVDALAAALAARGVPFAFASGYGPSGLPEGFRDRPLLGKPFGSEALVALVRGLLAPAGGGTVVPLRKRD